MCMFDNTGAAARASFNCSFLVVLLVCMNRSVPMIIHGRNSSSMTPQEVPLVPSFCFFVHGCATVHRRSVSSKAETSLLIKTLKPLNPLKP